MIIPILHNEKKVQVKDLTRFNADQTVLVKGSLGAIKSVKIQAGADQTAIEVFNALSKNWFLDWAFTEFKFDVDSSNQKVYFRLNDIVQSVVVPTLTYGLNDLLLAIKDELEASVPTLSVSVTLDERNRILFTPSLPLILLPKAGGDSLLQHLGFQEDGQLQGLPVEYGLRKVTLTVETQDNDDVVLATASIHEYVEVYSVQGDALFSDDADLVGFENDIMKWLPSGRGSYKDLHRKAQKVIVDWLDRQGYRDNNFKKLTKFAFVDNSDVRLWATYTALRLFFSGANNQVGDVFKEKSNYYKGLEIEARDRAVLSLDLSGDGKPEQFNGPDIRSGRLFYR